MKIDHYLLIVAKFFEKFKNSAAVKGCMTGLKPAVIGLIGSAAVSTALTVFFSNGFSLNVIPTLSFISSAIIFAVSLYFALKKKHPELNQGCLAENHCTE